MTREMLYEAVKHLCDRIDRDRFPDTGLTLDYMMFEDDVERWDLLKLAHELLNSDKPEPLPGEVTDFVESLYRVGIAEGDAEAMNNLGAMYYCGRRGFEQSYEQAVHYYKMGMEHGSDWARENLGYCYYYGRAGAPDYEKAFHCFVPGALEGRAVSMYKVGDMYLYGHYVNKDERQAYRLYNRCLELPDVDESMANGPVHLRLGDMNLKGLGTDWDPEQALLHYNLAEILLYRRVKSGDSFYRQSLHGAVEGQRRARALLMERLPAGDDA